MTRPNRPQLTGNGAGTARHEQQDGPAAAPGDEQQPTRLRRATANDRGPGPSR
ncbi:hypothetical protein [Streptomyces sp. NPDC094031]|uniref:hypothetical protein n=1 Tax=Streptomyces sp. NPDC094031 TaxID=3155307 RepID=UPI0033206D5E